MTKIKISFGEREWEDYPKEKRAKILSLMRSYGYDTAALDALEEYMEDEDVQDMYDQFYGDDE